MTTTFANALAWAKKELGGTETNASETNAAEDVRRAQAAIQASMAQITAAAETAAATDHRAEGDRRQAIFDALYFVAASDGSITPAERAKLAIGLRGMLGEGFEEDAVDDGLEMARVLVAREGKNAAGVIAQTITDEGERASLLLMASVVAWLGGGVGTKEGLALQALAGAFGIPIKTLHELMAAGAKAAKA
jgi:tellurite resistance protein